MPKYEHTYAKFLASVIQGSDFTPDVNIDLPLGMYEEEGWELVGFSIDWSKPRASGGELYVGVAFFKRPQQ